MKLIYLLGTAYSGSTLLSLYLGAQERVTNLGEVSSLEHDYAEGSKCTCGQILASCPFWSRVKSQLSESVGHPLSQRRVRLDGEGQHDLIDRRQRSALENIQLGLLRSAHGIYGDEVLREYAAKNVHFFGCVAQVCPQSEFLVDASKSSERLEALLTNDDIEIYCVWLRRSQWASSASKIMRLKRRLRKYSPLRAGKYLIWLRLREHRCRRVFESISENRRHVVQLEDFIERPAEVLEAIACFLDLPSKAFGNIDRIKPANQHIYVGNRWMFLKPERPIELQKSDHCDRMGYAEKAMVRVLFGGSSDKGARSG